MNINVTRCSVYYYNWSSFGVINAVGFQEKAMYSNKKKPWIYLCEIDKASLPEDGGGLDTSLPRLATAHNDLLLILFLIYII